MTIIYQDPYLLAADKPAGLLVHGDGTGAHTLTDDVRDFLRAQGNPNAADQVQPVNRLDVDTTGLVLFSLNKQVQSKLDALTASHDCHKCYLALVAGRLQPAEQLISQPIAKDRHDARRMRAAKDGKLSQTAVRTLSVQGNRTLVEAELHTGRRHQIRVHLSWLGHPIVGDRLYAGPASKPGLMLHAWKLEFVHPVTGELVALQTSWPARFPSK